MVCDEVDEKAITTADPVLTGLDTLDLWQPCPAIGHPKRVARVLRQALSRAVTSSG